MDMMKLALSARQRSIKAADYLHCRAMEHHQKMRLKCMASGTEQESPSKRNSTRSRQMLLAIKAKARQINNTTWFSGQYRCE